MALAYDFDIFQIIPDTGSSDSELSGFLNAIGFSPPPEAATVALFRDPRTADALRRAPPGLRAYLLDSGFGLNTFDSGAPRGRYPARDEAARLDLIRRLTDNARSHDLPRPDDSAEGGDVFRLGEFLAELDKTAPIQMPDVDPLFDDCEAAPVVLREPKLPPIFETDPITDSQPDAEEPAAPHLKFWQSRMLRFGAAAGLVLIAMQLFSGPALTALASL
ncbi:MAG: hypothetical protein U0934_11185 [Pseudotabrizicola sp.]|uniref:hypothetical protein n=1 Tax=Pseudotabrizicola sp. TaxID=2939647 RepID=UPI002721DD57|nr:hypothetical protein [Pseudotabrizicola sp.]MDO8883910.1 hypothetical protein [Pseudotabrizicola sp.]MDP2082972.1 hypothetical protein [Pseudotabrizicola sp.]MDZ7574504.1 hypothetical protein [Pseudotabrizicola sp.]